MGRATYGGFDSNAEQGVALVRLSAVPIPAAVWLFDSGLVGLSGLARRKKAWLYDEQSMAAPWRAVFVCGCMSGFGGVSARSAYPSPIQNPHCVMMHNK